MTLDWETGLAIKSSIPFERMYKVLETNQEEEREIRRKICFRVPSIFFVIKYIELSQQRGKDKELEFLVASGVCKLVN